MLNVTDKLYSHVEGEIKFMFTKFTWKSELICTAYFSPRRAAVFSCLLAISARSCPDFRSQLKMPCRKTAVSFPLYIPTAINLLEQNAIAVMTETVCFYLTSNTK